MVGTDPLLRDLGPQVKKLREKLGYSLLQLSQKSGISVGYLGDIEHGRKLPTLETLIKLSKALRTSLSELFSKEKTATVDPLTRELGAILESLQPRDRDMIYQTFKSMAMRLSEQSIPFGKDK